MFFRSFDKGPFASFKPDNGRTNKERGCLPSIRPIQYHSIFQGRFQDFSRGGGQLFFRIKLFQELGKNLKKRIKTHEKRYNTQEKGTKLKKKGTKHKKSTNSQSSRLWGALAVAPLPPPHVAAPASHVYDCSSPFHVAIKKCMI